MPGLYSRRAAAAAVLLAAAAVACDGPGHEAALTPDAIPDPTGLARTAGPHDALVCPPAACTAEPDRDAPAYPAATPEALFAAWRETVAAQPRAEVVACDPGRLLLLARQRSRLLGFVDTVAIRVLPAPGGGATFAAFSHSETGWWDLGVNAERLEDWQSALEARIGAGAREGAAG